MADRLAAVRQRYGPEAIVGATSGAYFSRSVIAGSLGEGVGLGAEQAISLFVGRKLLQPSE